MGVLRNENSKSLTIANNYIVQNSNISLKALGMYTKLIGLPDNWKFTEEGLASICKDGKDVVRSALKELEKLNLLFRFRIRDEKGRWGDTMYCISSLPMSEEEKEKILKEYDTDEK